MNLFITGTDTGVGKTFVTALLTRALAARGEPVLALKPVCCGDRQDAELLRQASGRGDLSLDDINPCWLKTPAAPLTAALIECVTLSVPALAAQVRRHVHPERHLLVEGVGGWEVPLTPAESVASLAAELGFPVLVVVDNKLGALNHTLLTVRRIEAAGLPLAGLVLNHTRPMRDAASVSNRHILESILGLPVLADLLFEADAIDLEGWDRWANRAR